MRAVVTRPATRGSIEVIELPKPAVGPESVLIAMREIGVDGTDREVIEGIHGATPPAGDAYLILGHESLGQIAEVGPGAGGLSNGDWVVCTVRRPDNCPNCRRGEIDMCLWGGYTERGIKGAHGFLAEYVVEETRFVIPVPETVRRIGCLIEPLSICEKVVEQARAIQRRLFWKPETALVFGLGTIGMLTAMLLRLRGLDVFVYSRDPRSSSEARLVGETGATYVSTHDVRAASGLREMIPRADLMVEATGSVQIAAEAMKLLEPNSVLGLLSITGKSQRLELDMAEINQRLVLGNAVIFGSVNSSRRHFERAIRDLERFEAAFPGVASRMITRRVQLMRSREAFEEHPHDIKVVIEVNSG